MLFAQKKRIAFDTLRVSQNNVPRLKFLDKERIGFIFDHLNSITNQTHADSPFIQSLLLSELSAYYSIYLSDNRNLWGKSTEKQQFP